MLQQGETDRLDDLNLLFSPTATFQEHSLLSNWASELLMLSENFDQLFAALKRNQ